MSDIRVTAKVAFDLVKQAAELFYEGTGIPLQPMDVDAMDAGFLDEIHPEGGDVRYWANQLLHFARTVHGILERALLEADDEL